MKVHDNSTLVRILIVLGPVPRLLKAQAFVKLTAGGVGLANLQPKGAAAASGETGEEPPPEAAPAESRVDRQIQDLGFAVCQAARDHEADDLGAADRHPAIVRQVIVSVPGRQFRASGLNAGDSRHIAGGGAPKNDVIDAEVVDEGKQ